jgi:hypothetical protein
MKGITEPRIYTKPNKELTEKTTLGYMAIDYAKNILGIRLYSWQEWALIHIFEIEGNLEKEWHFRYRTVVLLIARQNGKTILSKVIASFFLNVLQAKSVFGTSLSVEKAEEVWEAVIADQENIPELASEIDKVARQNGGKKLILKGGRTYKAGAPNRRAGRGDANDLVMLDELREHRDWETWSASVNSTNARPNAIVIGFSNAGDPDSIVLRKLREQAINKIKSNDKDCDLGLFEWSADEELPIDNIEGIRQANPALGYGLLTLRAIKSNLETMPENKFRSECLCQTVESLLPEPFPKGCWDNLLDKESEIIPTSDLVYGIDLNADRSAVSISVCGLREDGNYHIECIAKRSGIDWAIDWFRERAYKQPMKLAYQGRGAPVCGLAEQISTLQGIIPLPIQSDNLMNGWNRFYDYIVNDEGLRIYHLDQPVLNLPAKTMQLKNFGDGNSLPDRLKSPDDISPLFSAIMAFAGLTSTSITKEKKIYESAYNQDDYNPIFI